MNLLHLFEDAGSIVGFCYFKQQTNKKTTSAWSKAPFQFELTNGSDQIAINFAPDSELDPWHVDEYRADARTKYTEVLAANFLLQASTAEIEKLEIHTPALDGINRGRITARLHPIPPTIVIRATRASLKLLAQAHGNCATGPQKRPHERRGHYRTLQGGRLVWVKQASIHGGADEPPAYSLST